MQNGKNGLEIWWIAAFPQNLALICSTVSEKTRFTDGRTTDGRPRHSISSADSQAELKRTMSEYGEEENTRGDE